MIETNSSEASDILNALREKTDSESETRILTQKEVDELIKTYIAPLNKQLEDLTQLIERMSSVHRQNLSPRVSASTNSSAACLSPDMATAVSRKSPQILITVE